MQLKAWMENNGLSCAAVVDELKKLAPDRTATLTFSTVWRHMNGRVSPPEPMKNLYLQLTGGAVTSFDWSSLWNSPEAVNAREEEARRREKKKAEAA